jgi:hypothetical protein
MIDMNQSIESIMQECDYIAEHKEDINDQYNMNRAHERMSGDHRYAKAYRATKNDNRDMLSNKIPKSMGDRPEYHTKSMKEKRALDSNKTASAIRDEYKNIASNGIKRSELHKRLDQAGVKEASIFDDLLDLV